MAIYPDKLCSNSFIALADTPPEGVTHTRLDENTASDLCGWEAVPPRFRPVV